MNPKAAGSKAVPTPKSGVPIDGSLLYTLRQLDTTDYTSVELRVMAAHQMGLPVDCSTAYGESKR